jgi:asparagine synthase (glutamine-hydrolysing)
MCGINLFVDKHDRFGADVAEAMLESTRHRGPDRQGLRTVKLQGTRVYLGVNRLMISGLSEYSNQPFQPNAKEALLAYNGALYNNAAMKNSLLAQGYVFRSTSDTEVLYHHLTEHGLSGVRDLNGMYAIILIDPLRGEICFARDGHGIKPLYYYEDENILVASSEIRGVLASGLVDKKLNTKQIGHYLANRYPQPPETFYDSIYEFPPGSMATWSPGVHLHSCIQKTTSPITEENIPEVPDRIVPRVRAVIRDALLNIIDTEVPLGILLSGGVDSTLLLALAHEHGFSMPSFTITSGTSTYGTRDRNYAAMASRQYGSDHVEVEAGDVTQEVFEQHIRSLDQPIGDSSALMTQLVCGAASKSVKILLSGAGADELFAGYNRHQAFDFYLRYRNALLRARKSFFAVRALTPSGIEHPWRKRFRLLHKFLDSVHPDPEITFARMGKLYTAPAGIPETVVPEIRDPDRETWLTHALQADRFGYLISDVLALTDRMSMCHSIEVRPPYLDNSVATMAESIPAGVLLGRGRKWILKEILKSMGGEKYATRPKEGFGLPVGHWIRNEKHAYLCEPLKNGRSILHHYLDRQVTDDILRAHLQKKADYSQEIWALAVLAHWLAVEFG